MRPITRFFVWATAWLTLAVPIAGAQPTARVLLGGGTATDLQGVRSGAYLLAPSISFAPNPDVALSLGGRATRFSTEAWSLGGALGATTRVPLGSAISLVLSGSGDAMRTSYRATYFAADALPSLEWRRGAFHLVGGAHAAWAETRSDPAGPLPTGSVRVSRSSLGPAFGGGLEFESADRRESLRLSYREEHGNPDGVAVTDRVAALAVQRGRLGLSGSVGIRRAEGASTGFGGVRLALTVTRGITAIGAFEQYPSNRLTGTVGGRALTAGVSLSAGGGRRLGGFPKPAAAPAVRPGRTRLAISAQEAQRVEVAGDWNDWRPVPLVRSRNGVWYADLAIPAGVYRYAFRIDGKSWTVPKGVAAVDDGFGGRSAWLAVSASRTAPQSANRKEVP